ncbi:MAG: drug/metabolite exporter YedA [Actinomycetota bacterium]|nr:drug/metabolite exporter YedA [Actinomycetota bacterium]
MTPIDPATGKPRVGAMWAALGAIYFFWGTTYLAIRVGVETMPPFLMAGVRFLIAGGLLYVVAIRLGDRTGDRPTARHWRSAAIIGAALLFGGNGLVTLAEKTVPSGIAALMIATVPLWLVVFARLFLGDRAGWREWLGIAAGMVGLALLVNPFAEGGFDLAGMIWLTIAPLTWAAGSLYARRAALPKRALVGTSMEMLCGGAILLVAGIVTGELADLRLGAISFESLLGLGWLIVFGSIVGFTAYVWLLANARTSLVGTYAFVNPIVAVLLGWLILDEAITLRTVIAGAVIVVGVALIITARGARVDDDDRAAGADEPLEDDRVPA